MPAVNDFKVFAGDPSADVITQAAYEALAALNLGFATGTAISGQLNKVWRQSSIMAAVLAQFISDQSGNDSIDDGTTAALLLNLTNSITNLATTSVVGKHTIWVPAGSIAQRLTNGALQGTIETSTNKQLYKTLNFDQAINEYGQFEVKMPKSWNLGSVTAVFVWSNASASGNVVWGLQAAALKDTDALDAAWGTAQYITQASSAANLRISPETSAITLPGTLVAGSTARFQVFRDAANGSDTLAETSRLHGVALFYTTSAPTDA